MSKRLPTEESLSTRVISKVIERGKVTCLTMAVDVNVGLAHSRRRRRYNNKQKIEVRRERRH